MTNLDLFKFKPGMTPEEFEETNRDYFVDLWLEDNPHFAHLVNDGDLERYFEAINREYIDDILFNLKQ